jgi:hypothetical protein
MRRSSSPRVGWRRLLAGFLLCGAMAIPLAAQNIRVQPLVQQGRVLVSFTLADAFTDEIREAIHSGLQTSFTFDVELRRAATFGFDRTIASSQIAARVRYDNLTRRYQVSRTHDGRTDQERVTEHEQVVRELMTVFDEVPVFSTRLLESNGEYYVRIRARARPRNAWSVWPWDRAVAFVSSKFTFRP